MIITKENIQAKVDLINKNRKSKYVYYYILGNHYLLKPRYRQKTQIVLEAKNNIRFYNQLQINFQKLMEAK